MTYAMAPTACMLASCRTGCRHPPKSYQNPRALQAEVHSLGVHSLTRISSGCWTLLCPLNHLNLTFKHWNFTFKNPRTLQAEVHSLGVYSLTRISSECWTLLWPFNHSNLTFKYSNLTFKYSILTTWPAYMTPRPITNVLTDDAHPSLLALFWHILWPRMCFSIFEYAPCSSAADTRRNVNAM